MPDQSIKLELTIDEVNLILEALGDQPFKEVFTLVARLQSQARSQLGDGINTSSSTHAEQLLDEKSDAAPVP